MLYRSIIKPLLFLIPAEKAHHLSTHLFKIILSVPLLGSLIRNVFSYENPKLQRDVFGLQFSNPVGLAAGFDKDGTHYKTMSALGFGFIEIGTVTPLGQSGNEKPRLFRLPEDAALINRMGFNNEGVDALIERIKNRKKDKLIIGGNIGKNKTTPNEDAVNDYLSCFKKLYPYVDYFVLNVSSPNTPNLRSLQDKEPLNHLLLKVSELRNQQQQIKPILLKIAPDMNNHQIKDVLEIVQQNGIDGIIATNTTISREKLNVSKAKIKSIGNGGLSGQPLHHRSIEVVRYIRSLNSNIPIIGVGGINSENDALSMLNAGANLIQIYSGLIYNGPTFIKKLKKAIQKASK